MLCPCSIDWVVSLVCYDSRLRVACAVLNSLRHFVQLAKILRWFILLLPARLESKLTLSKLDDDVSLSLC